MQVDWSKLEYSSFAKALPKITQVYFGTELIFNRSDVETDSGYQNFYMVNNQGVRMLAVIHREKPFYLKDLLSVESFILESGASAGLIVTTSSQPFHLILIERKHGCWFPIAFWGKRQIEAIATLNNEVLSGILPFKTISLQPSLPSSSKFLGKGGALWSDIVKFVQLGINIGQKILMDPASVRARMIRQVDGCFFRSGGANATHRQKVGADGWFHFYKEPKGRAAVHLAIDSSIKLEQLAQTYRQLYREDLKVAMGINTVQDLRLDVGGPYDDDSIIAYYLTRQQIVQYHKRATKDAVENLVEAPKRPSWKHCGTFGYCDGRQIEIYGHAC